MDITLVGWRVHIWGLTPIPSLGHGTGGDGLCLVERRAKAGGFRNMHYLPFLCPNRFIFRLVGRSLTSHFWYAI